MQLYTAVVHLLCSLVPLFELVLLDYVSLVQLRQFVHFQGYKG